MKSSFINPKNEFIYKERFVYLKIVFINTKIKKNSVYKSKKCFINTKLVLININIFINMKSSFINPKIEFIYKNVL